MVLRVLTLTVSPLIFETLLDSVIFLAITSKENAKKVKGIITEIIA